MAGQTRVVLEHCGNIDAVSLDEYIAVGGYDALAKAIFDMTPDQVVDEIDRSGLRGRGGGGFHTGTKWKQVAAHKDAPVKYVVCNGDEGDPGAFMDGSVMEGDPYKLIEGMTLAGYAVGATEGYIYVRAEYPNSVSRLHEAIAKAEEAGLLGNDILGSGVSFHLHVNRGAGAFVCGEGSALTASIEGNRGMPRTKPPPHRGPGSLGASHRPQQRGDLRQRPQYRSAGRGLVPHYRFGQQPGHQDLFHHRRHRQYRPHRGSHGHHPAGDHL